MIVKSLKRTARASINMAARLVPTPIRRSYQLRVDASDFSGFSNPAMRRVAETRFFHDADVRSIDGWLHPAERQLLYGLGLHMDGPILEIGAWVGLSTVAIARGIRASGQDKAFTSCDLGLTTDHFRPVEDGMIGMFVDGENMGNCSQRAYRETMLPILSSPGGAAGQLKRNLKSAGVDDLVEVVLGDFKTLDLPVANVLFCDATHNLKEIETNAPGLRRLLRPGSIIAFHDVCTDPKLIAAVKAEFPVRHHAAVRSLFVGEIA